MSETTVWIAVDVGCIECGEPSEVLGIFRTEEEANAVLAAAREKQEADWHGQHAFEAHPVALPAWLSVPPTEEA